MLEGVIIDECVKRIKVPYFPIGIKVISPAFPAIGVYLWMIHYPAAWIVLFALPMIVILTTDYVTEFNIEKREVYDYLSVLTIQFQEERQVFDLLQKIVISKENHSQMLNSRSRSRQLDWSSYTGTLVHDGDKTLDLLTKTDKDELINALKEYAILFKVDVEDQTTSRHHIINMDEA